MGCKFITFDGLFIFLVRWALTMWDVNTQNINYDYENEYVEH